MSPQVRNVGEVSSLPCQKTVKVSEASVCAIKQERKERNLEQGSELLGKSINMRRR